jgi:hypothetical protein
MIAWAVATGLLACGVWVVVNPFLWGGPIERTWSMLEQQQSIMVEQGRQFGNPVDLSLPGRLLLMARRSFVDNSTPAFDYGAPAGSPPLIRRTFTDLPIVFGISAELALAAIGLGALLARAVAVWRAGRRHGVETALLWWLAAYLLGIGANLSLDWPRYYVPTAFYGALLIGLGVDLMVRAIWRRLPLGPRLATASATAGAEAAG